MATPAMGNHWLDTVLVQTGIKTDPSKITGRTRRTSRTWRRSNAGAKYFLGLPSQVMNGAEEVFTQIINNAFPAGMISVDDAVKPMDGACHPGVLRSPARVGPVLR